MPRNPRRSLVCSSLAFALAFAPSVSVLAATAANTADASATAIAPDGDPEALSGEAVEKFQNKEYDAAVDLFEQAYAIDPQPNYLFNIGRVYEEKGDLQNAVVYYQKFVGQSGVDLESRQIATERLKVLREALAQLEDDKANKGNGDQGTGDNTDQGGGDITDEPPVDDGADEAAAKRKKTLRITGYSLLGVGGAMLIVGGVFGGIASGTAGDAEADMFVDRRVALNDRARTQARVADAMFITGGIVAAAGLVLVLTTLSKKKTSVDATARTPRTQWHPVIGSSQVGLGLTHRF